MHPQALKILFSAFWKSYEFASREATACVRLRVLDENLTWEQVCGAKACYLSHVIEAGWDKSHINALVSFFINLDSHPYNHTPEGKQALVWYQAHAREEWHRKLGTA